VSGQFHAPAALPLGKEPFNTHWIGGWEGLRAGLHDVEKKKFLTLPGLKLRPLSHPALASCYTDRAIPVPKGILHTVSNTGIYCSSDKIGRVYLV
jgi:hypothetical protein